MEFTLAEQSMRLSLTFPTSRQGLVLTMDVDFRENGFPTTPTESFADSIEEDGQEAEYDGKHFSDSVCSLHVTDENNRIPSINRQIIRLC